MRACAAYPTASPLSPVVEGEAAQEDYTKQSHFVQPSSSTRALLAHVRVSSFLYPGWGGGSPPQIHSSVTLYLLCPVLCFTQYQSSAELRKGSPHDCSEQCPHLMCCWK